MIIYLVVSCFIGIGIGLIAGAYFHEFIFVEED